MVHQDNSQPDQQKRPAPAIQHPDVQEQPDQPSPQPDQPDQHLTSSNPQKRPNPQKQPNEEPENPVRQQK
ncbi:hypothetical protein B9T26_06725 [Acinetobacter sp. ANC 4169]|uniref:hypothetical protein n=1 Tax=Acinetobacter sp. ANC 4169 TaxID=1977879 RepID=UPI000A34C10C|nr:hypothetical protein [Acinetobacter sp. ANC 4169]OTG74527.1 hypothetical protein B9T26_06725 [Acinetobacter sp. ANC 4169]